MGSIVSGQTSVKAPERDAFEKHLPKDVSIVSCHSLHGPKVDPTGQPLVSEATEPDVFESEFHLLSFLSSPLQVLIQHRASDEQLNLVEEIFSTFKSRFVYLSYEEHDQVTANTQAVTHAAFLS